MIRQAPWLPSLLAGRRLAPPALEELRDQRLRALVRHAYEEVPFYRSRMDAAGVRPEQVRSVADLGRLPVTTKEDLRAAGPWGFLRRDVGPASLLPFWTSGSTGEPFTVYQTAAEIRLRRVVEFRSLLALGLRPRDRLVSLGPRSPQPVRLHQRLGLYRSVAVPLEWPAERQLERLRALRPDVLWIYPSLLRSLLERLDGRLSRVVRPRMMVTAAEVMDETLRREVRNDLGIDPYNFYGCIEVGRIAAECPTRAGLHVNADLLIVETLDEDGAPSRGDAGTVVITSLGSYSMPFIRYRLGDRAGFLGSSCPCGCAFPLLGPPLGRDWDMVRLPSGRLCPALGIGGCLSEAAGLRRYRVVRHEAGRLTLQLDFATPPPPALLSRLRTRVLDYLGEPVRLDVSLVRFPPGEPGKFRVVVPAAAGEGPAEVSRSSPGLNPPCGRC